MFTKGQKVTHISRWNNLGDFTYRDAIVYSCGKKRMILTDEITGEEIGRNYNPSGETFGEFTVPRLSVEDTIALASEKSKEFRIKKEELLRHCLTIDASDSYKQAIQVQLDELLNHNPVIMTHSEAKEIVKKKVAAKYR